MTPTQLDALLAALAGIPRLPGALCRGQSETFDAADDEQRVAAVQLCRRCPALVPCSAWADTLDPNDVDGVVAGRIFVWASHPSLRRQQTVPQ